MFPNLAATALKVLHQEGEGLEWRSPVATADADGFVSRDPGTWAAFPPPFVVSYAPVQRSRANEADGDRVRGRLLICAGSVGVPEISLPPLVPGDEIRYDGAIWEIQQIANWGNRSGHVQIECSRVESRPPEA